MGSEEGRVKKEEYNTTGVSATAPVGAAPFNAFAGNGIVGRFGPAGQLSGSMPTAMALSDQKPLGVGGSTANVPVVQNAPTFQKDDTKKDGGFFGWLGGLIKKRPGIRSGESADEYDERMTRNKMRIATLADAIRHMGNIYYTSKGAPLQRFNNPVEGLQNGLQQRKNERARQAALDADAAYKNANLRLKQASADAARAYNAAILGYKAAAEERAKAKAETDERHWQQQFDYMQKKDKDELDYRKKRDGVKNNQWLANYKLAWYRANKAHGGGSGSGSGSGSSGGVGGGYGYATPYGRLASKKQLTAQQEAQAWAEMRNLGMITPQKQRKLDLAMNGYTASDGTVVKPNATQARKVIQDAISYGLLDSSGKGESLRKTFRDGFGYTDVRTSATAQRGVNTSGKKKVRNVTKTVSKSQAKQIREQRKGANPIRWQGSGSKPKPQSKPTNKGRGTDWSQYVK